MDSLKEEFKQLAKAINEIAKKIHDKNEAYVSNNFAKTSMMCNVCNESIGRKVLLQTEVSQLECVVIEYNPTIAGIRVAGAMMIPSPIEGQFQERKYTAFIHCSEIRSIMIFDDKAETLVENTNESKLN